MKKILCLLVCGGLAAGGARAAIILYEPFDYSNVGSPVSDNDPGNWAFGGTGVNDAMVVAGSLSYSGLAASIGNSLETGGAGLGVRRLSGTTVTGGTLYFSALFRMNTIGTQWTAANASVGALTETNNTGFKVSVLVSRNFDNTGYVFGVQKGGTGTTPTSDTTSYFEGDTILLVGSYTFDPVNPDVSSLWINPAPATFELAIPPSPTLTAMTGLDSIAGLDRFNFRQNVATGTNSVPEAMQWDELRIGDSWADVTPIIPEPAAATLFGLAAAGFVCGRWLRGRRLNCSKICSPASSASGRNTPRRSGKLPSLPVEAASCRGRRPRGWKPLSLAAWKAATTVADDARFLKA